MDLFFKKGNSLVVQWLGLCAFTAGGQGSIPGWGTEILQAEWPKKKKKGKKWIYLQRYTFHRQNAIRLRRREWPQGMGLSQKVKVAKEETLHRVRTISEGERP